MKHKANNEVGRGSCQHSTAWEEGLEHGQDSGRFLKYLSVIDRSVGYKTLCTVQDNKSLPNSTGLNKNIQMMLSHHLLIRRHC